jgi:hypothetical protein
LEIRPPPTFDGIAIGAGTRLIIYPEKNLLGEPILDKTGPAIINNVNFQCNPKPYKVMMEDWPEPLQSQFPQSVREWSETEMNDYYGEPGWTGGSFEIITP